MEITTKYSIGDIINLKWNKTGDIANRGKSTARYEVLFIDINTCSAGSQIFYMCRPIVITTKEIGYVEEGKTVTTVLPSDTVDISKCRFREDEVIDCDPETLELLRK